MARKHRGEIVRATFTSTTKRFDKLERIAVDRNAWITKKNKSRAPKDREEGSWIVVMTDKLDTTLFSTPKLVFKKQGVKNV